MSVTLGDITNAPGEVEYRGKVYPMRDLTILERGMFSRWLETRARAAVGRATDLPKDLQERLLGRTIYDIAAGVYEYGGEAYIVAVNSIWGMAYAIHLSLRETHPECTHDFCIDWVTEVAAKAKQKELDDLRAKMDLDLLRSVMNDPGN